MTIEQLREQLYASYKNRALLYYLIYDELCGEVGKERAAAILTRAIRRRGEQLGQKYAAYGPADLEGLKQAFLANMADDGRMFSPQVTRSDTEGLDIHLTTCPLKEAWLEAGLAEDAVAELCAIAATVDEGMFRAAGFAFSADTWRPGRTGCCHLHLRPGGGEI